MHILVTGGTGFIGAPLCRHVAQQGHHVTVLTRNVAQAGRQLGAGVELLDWDGSTPGRWAEQLTTVDAIVNLAGASIADGRWTADRKRVLIDSRVNATRALVDALASLLSSPSRPPRPIVLVNASGIGYYGTREDQRFYEQSPKGVGFLADLSAAWEAEAIRAESLGLRVVRLRLGMVLEHDGGALPRMLLPFRLGVGGPVLPGTQWMSWIHRQDVITLIEWAIRDRHVSGAVNAVSPHPVTMQELCRVLGRVLHRPSWLPVPGWALRLALGEMGTLLTTGQHVQPVKALTSGVPFHYPDIGSALQAILCRDQGHNPGPAHAQPQAAAVPERRLP